VQGVNKLTGVSSNNLNRALEAKQDLLYVSASDGSPNLLVLTYPQGQLIGGTVLDGIPDGVCSDKNGNVYVTAVESTSIYEFAHGDTTPYRTLVQPDYFTSGCSVDATSGDLAVADFSLSGPPGKHGGVSIFSNATGTPKVYKTSKISWYEGCAYDGQGNLFVVGIHGRNLDGPKDRVVVAELPKGGNSLDVVTTPQQFYRSGKISWDGTFIVLSSDSKPIVYRYRSSANGLLFKNSVSLDGGATAAPFWIQKNKIISGGYNGNYFVGIWRYPQGGNMKRLVSNVESNGITVSVSARK
jgi:hypothetical protein